MLKYKQVTSDKEGVEKHFKQLKEKQKETQNQFHKKLMMELEHEQSRSQHTTWDGSSKKIAMDLSEEAPVTHLYDPLNPSPGSPIPRKRHESQSNQWRLLGSRKHYITWLFSASLLQEDPEPPLRRRGSLDHNLNNVNAMDRTGSLPRKFHRVGMAGRYASESYLNKSDFWTGSLTRTGRRRVKFEDDPPARPPPPAPLRQESLNIFQKHLQQQRQDPTPSLFDHSNDEEHKVDLGHHKDLWFEQYGKAVLDNSLQDRIEARKQKMKVYSPTQQVVMQEDQQKQSLTQSFPPYDMVRNIVLKILRGQGVPDPSEAVIDNAIKEYFDNAGMHNHSQPVTLTNDNIGFFWFA